MEDRADCSHTGFERLSNDFRPQGLRHLSAVQGGHVGIHLPGCLREFSALSLGRRLARVSVRRVQGSLIKDFENQG